MIVKNVNRMRLFLDAPWYDSRSALSTTKILSYIQRKVDEAECSTDEIEPEYREWESLSNLALCSEHALLEKNSESAAINMFLLGLHTQILGSVSIDDSIDMLRAKLSREEPLLKKASDVQAVNSMAKSLAIEVWNDDVDQDLTLSDVCNEVYAVLHMILSDKEVKEPDDLEYNARFLKSLPSSADGFKRHLRGVAPNYATKPGRRKK